jgi:hypothetical protein
MVRSKMGRYWEQTKRWFFRKVWSFKTKEGRKAEVSKMRASCKSHTNERLAKGECCQTKGAAGNTGPKPTNVKTFAKKRKSMSMGGMV